jgi:hypothetical protein
MKPNSILWVVAALALSSLPALAHKDSHTGMDMKMHASSAQSTVTGEVVDTGCYLGSAERGAKHVSCATKCIAQGMPMGLLTSDAKLYLLTMNHDNADPYNQLKDMAGKTVSVTGSLMTRGGMKGIDVVSIKPVAAQASK